MMTVLQPKKVKVIRATSQITDQNILRVAAYCRVSTDSDDQTNSFIAQVKYYNDFIRRTEGMELVDIYADQGITGTSAGKRPEFQRMLKDSRLGKIDRIYVKSVTRFARNSLECLENVRILKANGTAVYFENDGINTETMNSEMILYIKSAFAQSEALSCSKRVSTACRMRMENGTFVTTKSPFGYCMEDRKLCVIPEEAEIIRKIYEMYLSGMGYSKICAELNKTANEYAPWKSGHVMYIIKNEKYIGDSLWQKKFTPHNLPFKKRRNNGEVEQYYAEGTHEAIVEKPVFYLAQQLVAKKSEQNNNAICKKHKYSGIIFCGECGNVYKKKYPLNMNRWLCSKSGIEGRYCNTPSVTETEIENTFVNFYNRLKQHENTIFQTALSQMTALKKRITIGCEGICEINREMASLADENSMYVRYYQQEMMDEITFREQTDVIRKRTNKLRVRRQKLLHEDEEEASVELLRNTKERLAEMPEAILWFDRKLFDELVNRIVVISRDTLLFELKCGIKLKEKIEWN